MKCLILILIILLIHLILSNYPKYSFSLNSYTSFKYLETYPILFILLEYELYDYALLFIIFYWISDIDFRLQEIPDLSHLLILIYFYNQISFNLFNLFIIIILFFFSYIGYIGFGDIKLLLTIALIYSNNLINIMFIASLLCLIINLNKKDAKISFAPYICIASLLTITFQ